MSGRNVEKWDLARKQSLFPLRASAFHGKLTEAQYLDRNRHIYSIPFGQERIHTYALLDDAKTLLSSCELLEVDFASKRSNGITRSRGTMIAAVVTPEQFRGKGHCTFLLNEVFRMRGDEDRILFSDIDPAFYARMGFHLGKTYEWDIPALAPRNTKAGFAISIEELASLLTLHRLALLEMASPSSVVLTPSAELLNWHLERYRAYHAIKKRPFPRTFAWEVKHCEDEAHIFFAVPNVITSSLDCLWIARDCAQCFDFAKATANSHGLPKITVWAERAPDGALQTHLEKPMLRFIDLKAPVLIDAQPCDYW
jgi:hypothetical protein